MGFEIGSDPPCSLIQEFPAGEVGGPAHGGIDLGEQTLEESRELLRALAVNIGTS